MIHRETQLAELQKRVKVVYSFMHGKEIRESFIPKTIEDCKLRLKYYKDEYNVIY